MFRNVNELRSHFQFVEEDEPNGRVIEKLTNDELQRCFEQYKSIMHRYIDRGGDYIDKDKSRLSCITFFTPVLLFNYQT